jgi:hypothetical protein
MSYLARYLTRHGGTRAWIDERATLNHPDFDGGAHVRAFVEDTSARTGRFRGRPSEPKIRLLIADCAHAANLEFSVGSPEARANALFKIDTLLGVLLRFRDGLAAEADRYAERERARHSASGPKLAGSRDPRERVRLPHA